MKQFFQLSAVSLLLIFIWMIKDKLPFPLHPFHLWIVGFFFLQSIITTVLFKTGQKKMNFFVGYFMGAIVFRFISDLLLLIFFLFFETAHFQLLSFEITSIYLLYLIFEMRHVLVNLQRN